MDPETFGPGSPRTPAAGSPATSEGVAKPGRDFDAGSVPAPAASAYLDEDRSRPSQGFLGSVKQRAASQLNAQKDRATDQLDHMAESVRRSTERLRHEHHGVVAVVLERAVDELERFSAQLRARDVNDLVADLEGFGRRHPALFVGSSFAAGLMLARFAKASNASVSASARTDRPRSGGRMSNSFSRPGPADAIGQESQ